MKWKSNDVESDETHSVTRTVWVKQDRVARFCSEWLYEIRKLRSKEQEIDFKSVLAIVVMERSQRLSGHRGFLCKERSDLVGMVIMETRCFGRKKATLLQHRLGGLRRKDESHRWVKLDEPWQNADVPAEIYQYSPATSYAEYLGLRTGLVLTYSFLHVPAF